MTRLTSGQLCYAMGKDNEPAARVQLSGPQKLIFQTVDCYGGKIKPGGRIKDIDTAHLNPATGPVYLEGAHPGDVLEIHIDKIECQSPGLSFCEAGGGLLAEESRVEELRFYEFDDETIDFGNGIRLPQNPMIGVIGVAAKDTPVPNAVPGDHGGNMDTTMIKEGAVLYLPVFHEGALLAVGDLHAAMGDGEAFFEGVEVAGEVELTVALKKDMRIDIPFVKADGRLATIATEKTIDGALKKAMSKLVHFVEENTALSFTDAAYICGFYGDLEISQVVDPLMTARMGISLSVLEKLGIHI